MRYIRDRVSFLTVHQFPLIAEATGSIKGCEETNRRGPFIHGVPVAKSIILD
jgi:hypothetical protein